MRRLYAPVCFGIGAISLIAGAAFADDINYFVIGGTVGVFFGAGGIVLSAVGKYKAKEAAEDLARNFNSAQ